ncbi:helix-turn-helix transcriptional regulator [Comamonadaceae bacterium PP-2]
MDTTLGMRLVDQIYGAAAGEVEWSVVLEGIRTVTDSRLVSLLSVSPDYVPTAFTAAGDSAGWTQGCLAAYGNQFVDFDPCRQALMGWTKAQWFRDDLHLSRSTREQGVFHQEFLKPFGMGAWSGVFVEKGLSGGTFLAMFGQPDKPVSALPNSLKDELVAHLGRARQLEARLASAGIRQGLTERAMHALDQPLLVIDSQRTLLFANEAGARVLSQQSREIRFVNGRLATPHPMDDATWRAACRAGRLRFSGDLQVDLTPMPQATKSGWEWHEPATLVCLPKPRSSRPSAQAHLIDVCKLSEGEAAVCIMLALEGLSIAECADRRAVTSHTIKTQLRSIFAKTGMRRQQDLVRYVASI